ncbi:DUF6183 family protein [Streptomyces sp. NPDC051909]|uniref:DUF6183 family protein n=1 Tax=Streptomyces sp. NPDC051909 TaxID=3154944 RepID=UPI0034160E60
MTEASGRNDRNDRQDRNDRIREIVAVLPGMQDVSEVTREVERWIARGDAVLAADLGIALARADGGTTEVGHAADHWQCGHILDHVLQRLAVTPGADHAAQALRLVRLAGGATRKSARSMASLLATGQRPEDLVVAFRGPASEELRACLVHELVLRDVAVDRIPGIAQWATSPHWRHHPLGGLPLSRSSLEPGLRLLDHRGHDTRHRTGYGRSGVVAMPVPDTPVPSARDVTAEHPVTETALDTAVTNWTEGSNGVVEARIFDLDEELSPFDVPAALPALGLACLDGIGPKTPLSVGLAHPADVWQTLFRAASAGGAYSSGGAGAYGRLHAWCSLAALAGCPDPWHATVDEIEARASECDWFEFEARTDWFHMVAWDIGVAALSPDGRRLVVLAATDTD